MTSSARSWYVQGSPRTVNSRPGGWTSRCGSVQTAPPTATEPEAIRPAHSRRVPNPWLNSSCASVTNRVPASRGQLEHDDMVGGGGPGAADDPLVVELADDRPRVGVGRAKTGLRHAGDARRDARRRARAVEDDAVARHAEIAARPGHRHHRGGAAVGVAEALGTQAG